MAKAAKVAWGIDVGNCTLKAIKIGVDGDHVELLDFAVIEHESILSQPEIDPEQRNELINTALAKFIEQHPVENVPIIVSVPGQNSFARFIKLPPVEKKRIPEIVKFEAMQQIPFDIEDVEWDWQTFQAPENPDIEVGIFAIKKDLVGRALEPFVNANCQVASVQMAPMALYNFIHYDSKTLQQPDNAEAIITLDIGAENTDLVIAEGQRVWQRSIPIGGNHFTAAVQKAFKLSFTKAEAIKRTANTSKYARQIFQAMRSVFADLAGEIQRSIGFYSSSRRDVHFRQVLALGNAVKLPGLAKFLQQSLSLPVKRLDSFESLKISPDVSVAQFTENLSSLAVAYGLALQEVGFGAIQSNLLPREIARQTLWKRKRKWFAAAAGIVLAASFLNLFQVYSQQGDLQEAQASIRRIDSVQQAINNGMNTARQANSQQNEAVQNIEKRFEPFQQRDILPKMLRAIRQCLPNEQNIADPCQMAMLQAYRNGDREGVMAIPRNQRQQIFLTSVQIIYTDDLSQSFDAIVASWSNRRQRQREAAQADPAAAATAGGYGGFGPMMGPGGFGPGGFGPMGPMGPGGQSPSRRRSSSSSRRETTEKTAGFVVILEGYTPNADNYQFLRPAGVGIDRSQWGFFQRMQYLGKNDATILSERQQAIERQHEDDEQAVPLTDVQATNWQIPDNQQQAQASQWSAELPFQTYFDPEADDTTAYFDYTATGWVTEPGSDTQPAGIGIRQPEQLTRTTRNTTDRAQNTSSQLDVRVDPFTYEPVSAAYQLDEQGNIVYDADGRPVPQYNDYWFRLRFKIVLKNSTQS